MDYFSDKRERHENTILGRNFSLYVSFFVTEVTCSFFTGRTELVSAFQLLLLHNFLKAPSLQHSRYSVTDLEK